MKSRWIKSNALSYDLDVAQITQRVGWSDASVSAQGLLGEGPPTAPPPSRLWRDAAGVLGAARLPAAAVRLRRATRGDGHTVVDVPGWKAPEAAAWPLRRYLRWLGYDARPWGLGTNDGHPERDADDLARRVRALARDGGPVSLLGWSLGGVIAREVARQEPASVRRVVSYGSPVVGGPTFTVGARAFGRAECERASAVIERLDREQPVGVPLTVILSRRDGVVAWRACLDRSSTDVEHVEVTSTHTGLGFDPDVWQVVADRLARPVRRTGEAAS